MQKVSYLGITIEVFDFELEPALALALENLITSNFLPLALVYIK